MAMAKSKIKLPKSILEMKFMKKSKEKIEKELEITEGYDDLYSNVITNQMRQASGNFITEPSFIYCESLIEGRVSYKGMNPEIERLMELESKPEEDMLKDVSDEILAKKFQSLKRTKQRSHKDFGPTAKRKK